MYAVLSHTGTEGLLVESTRIASYPAILTGYAAAPRGREQKKVEEQSREEMGKGA